MHLIMNDETSSIRHLFYFFVKVTSLSQDFAGVTEKIASFIYTLLYCCLLFPLFYACVWRDLSYLLKILTYFLLQKIWLYSKIRYRSTSNICHPADVLIVFGEVPHLSLQERCILFELR